MNWLFLIFFVNYFQKGRTSTLIGTNLELCGHENEIIFNKLDETSSMIITLLSPIEYINNDNCKLKIKAPETYLIHMQFIDKELFQRRINRNSAEEESVGEEQRGTPCIMKIYLPHNPHVPVWEHDLCSSEPIKDIDLLTSDFEIVWTPPKPQQKFINNGRKIVLTTIGQGPECKEPGHHICTKIGQEPISCISDELLCDGINNCPKASTTNDEDDELCNLTLYAPTSFKQLAEELLKRLHRPTNFNNSNNTLLSNNQAGNLTTPNRAVLNWREWQQLKKIELSTTIRPVKEDKNKLTDSISQALSKYGPWGYLMLGMLICGTVLMLCGLWECCIRKPKSHIIDLTPSTSIPQPTTVLIINQQQDDLMSNTSTLPPNYEDLDQPPSYTTLFPNFKEETFDSNSCNNNSNIIIDIDSTECSNSNSRLEHIDQSDNQR